MGKGSDESECDFEAELKEEDEEDEEEDDEEVQEVVDSTHDDEADSQKALNVAALLRGDVQVQRQALLPRVLTVSDAAVVIRRPFKSPCPRPSPTSQAELLRRLQARKRFVPWGCTRSPFTPIINGPLPLASVLEEEPPKEELPPGVEPLILWQPDDCDGKPEGGQFEKAQPIIVDPHLVKFLRLHQREGVQFMFECVAGLRGMAISKNANTISGGCILADDMGLGKTLQSITLMWTLLKQGFDGKPMAKRVVIITPTSLVSNWEQEITKWLSHSTVNVLALCESTRADVLQGVSTFLSPQNFYQVLIVSYETFRLHAQRFEKEGSCDLLICDEAHRLKNDKTLTNQALASLPCFRRVLLSGTPMQNDLEEFFAMVNFTNPGVLGGASKFRKYYENPILTGREPDATDEARSLSIERSAELSEKVNQFILRRTNALLSNHLPPKIVAVVCCKMTELQTNLYRHFIRSKNVRQALEDQTKRAKVLASITALKKLCNHPKLIYDTIRAGGSETAGFGDCLKLFPQHLVASRSGAWPGWIELSGKMAVLARLLSELRCKTDDRIVLVSNYTQTLDLFAQICRERNYPFVRLDGTTSIGKRQKLVSRFNDPNQNEFAFLLSSKAGGCGLNLIGGNRLVLFDPDWNPATDKQAAARVWRDGQKKRVYVYRFLASGSIEEKVFQRQMSKEGLQKVVDKEQSTDAKAQVNMLSTDDLRDLFTLREDIKSDTHDSITCERCDADADSEEITGTPDISAGNTEDIGEFAKVAGCSGKLRSWERQIGTPAEEDLLSWAHHGDSSTVPDAMLQAASADQISFTFTCQVDGKLTPIDSFPRTSSPDITPSLTARAFAPLVSRELRAPKIPLTLNGCTTGINNPNLNTSEGYGVVTPPAKTTLRGFPPSSRKSPATVLPRTPKAAPPSKKRPKITITHKASKHMAASKHLSDESSASEYVSDDDEDDGDEDDDDDDDDDFA
ncbi:hypothetical protein M758_UG273900 [Ceratodon purpureus]|nr:hypothetical protein M758_UG273900 [Ceratodon purpureus]